jgi:5'-nucleotidase
MYNQTMKTHILLTNDDGILSPGLWSAAQALSALGFVHVVAPREQWSGAGRSLPNSSDGIITPKTVTVNNVDWTVYSVGGTPAQAVLHAILEILPERPSLVVSGINYGENIGSGVTISGTVGAALEASAMGIPALAISLETAVEHHLSYSDEVDFSTAAHFTQVFARILLTQHMPADVDVLKVDIPSNATIDTPWRITRQSRMNYFEPLRPDRTSWDQPGCLGYRHSPHVNSDVPGTDVHTVRTLRQVSVAPLSLDLTSRIAAEELEKLFKHS